MSNWIVLFAVGSVALAGLGVWTGSRRSWLPPLLLVLGAGGGCAAVLASISPHPELALTDVHLGRLLVSRLAAAVAVGGWAALLLELGVWRSSRVSGGWVAMALLTGTACTLALCSTAFIPLALLLAAASIAVWTRWLRLTGPALTLRSLGRQNAVVFCALAAAAAILPSERLGAAPAALTAMLLVGGLGGVIGLLPLSGWLGAAARVPALEAAPWRVWLVPLGLLTLARVLVSTPPGLARAMQLLLLALGLATALFWSAVAISAPQAGRYWRVLGADIGVMVVGIACADPAGVAGALLLVTIHWLVGASLSGPSGSRSHLLSWIGLSGAPPFGGFTGRLLVMVGATFAGPVVLSFLLLAFGLQLVACGAGARRAGTRTARRGVDLGEALALAAALGSLLLGVVAGPVLGAAFGVRI